MGDLLYDTDFFAWTQETAAKIRECRFHDINLKALAEEIEDLGKRDWTEVNSRLRVIIMHLLKLDYQPEKKTDSWVNSISRERTELEGIFDFSPSLRAKALQQLPVTYVRSVREAARETKLPKATFPAECPYTYEQILDHDFYPSEEGCD
jgi:uncharacterized protein DUF29